MFLMRFLARTKVPLSLGLAASSVFTGVLFNMGSGRAQTATPPQSQTVTATAPATPQETAWRAQTQSYVHVAHFTATIDPGLQKDSRVSAAAKAWAHKAVADYNARPYADRAILHNAAQTYAATPQRLGCKGVVLWQFTWYGLNFIFNHCVALFIRYIVGPTAASIAAVLVAYGFPAPFVAPVAAYFLLYIGWVSYLDNTCPGGGVAGTAYLYSPAILLYCP